MLDTPSIDSSLGVLTESSSEKLSPLASISARDELIDMALSVLRS
jgi:hypothetical protein